MKKYFLLVAIFNIFFVCAFAQSEEDIVKQIRQQFKTINDAAKTYTVEKKTSLDEESGAEQTVNAYLKGKQLMKIEEKFFGDMTENFNQYYFWNNQLFFVFTTYTYYMPTENAKPVVSENRYYFSNYKLIRWIDSEKQQQDKNSNEYAENEKSLLEKAQSFLSEFKK